MEHHGDKQSRLIKRRAYHGLLRRSQHSRDKASRGRGFACRSRHRRPSSSPTFPVLPISPLRSACGADPPKVFETTCWYAHARLPTVRQLCNSPLFSPVHAMRLAKKDNAERASMAKHARPDSDPFPLLCVALRSRSSHTSESNSTSWSSDKPTPTNTPMPPAILDTSFQHHTGQMPEPTPKLLTKYSAQHYQVWSKLAKFGRNWPSSRQNWPNLARAARVWPIAAKSGKQMAQSGGRRLTIGLKLLRMIGASVRLVIARFSPRHRARRFRHRAAVEASRNGPPAGPALGDNCAQAITPRSSRDMPAPARRWPVPPTAHRPNPLALLEVPSFVIVTPVERLVVRSLELAHVCTGKADLVAPATGVKQAATASALQWPSMPVSRPTASPR